ncbi:MAG TPA: hypothetical protein VGQ83_31595 [Polyangia bacterium]
MRTRGKVIVMFAAATVALAVGVVASAQNLNVAGNTTGQGNAYFLGNVGIGTATPSQKLTVAGRIARAGGWMIGDGQWGTGAFEVHNSSWDGASNNNYGTIAAGHGYFYNGLQTGGPTGAEAGDGELYVGSTAKLMGAVGIGTTTPADRLTVATGGQYFRAATWGIGITDPAWTNTAQLSNDGSIFKIWHNGGRPLALQTETGGNVGIGTTAPAAKLDVNGPIHSGGGHSQRDVFSWSTTASTPTTVHLKTNWRTNNSAMYRVIVEGYNYGAGLAINSDCVGYLYSGTDSILNASCNNYAGGITLSQYRSTDGSLVLKVTAGTFYYLGFGVSLQQYNPTGVQYPTFTAYHQDASL